MTVLIPSAFAAMVAAYPPDHLDPAHAVSGADWVAALPRLVDDLLDTWSLVPDGESRSGHCALAVPVRSRDGVTDDGPAVLKVTWPDLEAATEHLALRHWDGRGAVRLLRADPRRHALLLERLDATTDLSELWIDEACEVVGGLLRQLSSPAIARTPTLGAYAARQAAAPDSGVLPPRFTDQARHLAVDLALAPGLDARLLHTDLHYANVLAAERQPWLAIDPKPMAGEAAYRDRAVALEPNRRAGHWVGDPVEPAPSPRGGVRGGRDRRGPGARVVDRAGGGLGPDLARGGPGARRRHPQGHERLTARPGNVG